MSMQTLWGKSGQDAASRDWFFEFTAREDRELDRRLLPFDLMTNLAQARALHRVGIVTEAERDQLLEALRALWERAAAGEDIITEVDEDVHSAVERELTAVLGDTGKRIHTGRSRNDQVLCDMRLYLRDALLIAMEGGMGLIGHLRRIADEHPQLFFPGYTHTQPAMPNSADAWCAGYIDLLLADWESLKAAWQSQRWCPLGSAAGYGVPQLPVDRIYLAELLGFEGPQKAVTASQLGRGALEMRVVDALGYFALTLNRMAADVVTFANPDLGWVSLSDDQTSGSSIMPQKRNPDAWELIRGAAHRFAGLSAQLYSLTSNLGSGYHRDLQNVKAVVMQAVDAAAAMAEAASHGLAGLTFNREKATARLSPELFATDRANRYVAEGLPFRDAYRKTAADLASLEVPDPEAVASAYNHLGSPAEAVAKTYDDAVSEVREWLEGKKQDAAEVRERLIR